MDSRKIVTKPRLLFLTSRLPYPPIAGIRLKNYHLIRELAKTFRLTIVSIGSEPLPSEASEYIGQFGELRYCEKTRADFARSAAAAPFRLPLPFQASLYYFGNVNRSIRNIAGDHDAVFCNLIRTTAYTEGLAMPRFCDLADSISNHYAHVIRKSPISPLTLYYRLDRGLIRSYEEKIIREFDQCFMFNQEEMDSYHAPSHLTWIPHGVSPALLKDQAEDSSFESSVVFLGKMDYGPNVAAAQWFARYVVPLLSKDVSFVIIGANPARSVQELASDRVKVLGFVSDPYPALRSALAVVAPMQFGGGVQNKLLEAMAVGGLCIATSAPARALKEADHGRELLVADTPDEFAEAIETISRNPRGFLDMRKSAREFIAQHHSWESAGTIYTGAILKGLH